MNYITAILFFLLYAKIEQVLYDQPPDGGGFQPPDNNKIFGMFSAKYHLPLLAIFVVVTLGLGVFRFLPGLILLEDASYFALSKQDSLSEKSWVTGKLRGFRIKGQYIPNVYVGLALFQIGVLFL